MARPKTEPTAPEWSYLVEEDKAGTEITHLRIAPSETEKEAICRRLNLLALDRFEAEMDLFRAPGGMTVEVKGVLEADVTQACVVTLAPVKSHIREEFEAWFADPEKAVSFSRARRDRAGEKNAELPMIEEHEDPEPVIEGRIDLGDLATQYLSLALDPYPHAEGAVPPPEDDGDQGPSPLRRNPFAGLKDWKSRLAPAKDK